MTAAANRGRVMGDWQSAGEPHSPTPWEISPCRTVDDTAMIVGGKNFQFGLIADVTEDSDAAFIVTACNAHEKLVEALTYAIGELQAFYDASCDGRIKNTVTIGQFGRLETCRAALSLATQKGAE